MRTLENGHFLGKNDPILGYPSLAREELRGSVTRYRGSKPLFHVYLIDLNAYLIDFTAYLIDLNAQTCCHQLGRLDSPSRK